MKEVLVIQRRLTHYRVPFFDVLRVQCEQNGIRLRIAFGSGTAEESTKSDSGSLDWAEPIPTRYLFGERLCWQPFSHLLNGVDMVVVAQENKLINNLGVQYFNSGIRLGLWGHGANLQGEKNSIREKFKRVISRKADWWFAYTRMSTALIERCGFPSDRITVLNNSVDTHELASLLGTVNKSECAELRLKYEIVGNKIGAYVGSLYSEKRIEFMLDAALKIRERVPDFELMIIGTGPQTNIVESFCGKNPWAKYLGAQKGRDKVALLSLANLLLNPGLVGLGILDSFVCGLPMVTTDCGLHSPEIAYLENHVNGLMTENDLEIFVTAVTELLNSPSKLDALRAGCLASAEHYSIDNMAANFVDGALRCLESPIVRFSS